MNELRERARHHWQGILGNLGISGSLKNKHQPCPCCGGKDRFRFDDKDGYGTFICNQCGAGDGFRLVMNLLQCDFKHAASIVESYLGNGWVNAHPIATTPAKTQEQPEKQQDKQAKLLSIFEQAKPLTPDSPAVQYLHQRGITLRARARIAPEIPQMLRYHPALPYWTQHDSEPMHMGNRPALIAAITQLDGTLQGLHCTYLQQGTWQKLAIVHPQTGEPLPAKKMQTRYGGALTGAAVQLYPIQNNRLAVAEGIETALAARELLPNCPPVWAALSANGMASLVLPGSINELWIIADNDTPRPIGMQAAETLANRAIKAGIAVKLWQPETQGWDALDELTRSRRNSIS